VPRRKGRHDLKRIILLVFIGGAIYLARPKQVENLAEDAHRAVSESLEDVTGKTAKDISDHALSTLRKDNLQRALRQYENLRGKKPEELEELVREGLVDKADLVDEWGRSLKVEVTTQGIVVRSAGRDGRFHTGDDWTLGES
jgi:hypothetical protein